MCLAVTSAFYILSSKMVFFINMYIIYSTEKTEFLEMYLCSEGIDPFRGISIPLSERFNENISRAALVL